MHCASPRIVECRHPGCWLGKFRPPNSRGLSRRRVTCGRTDVCRTHLRYRARAKARRESDVDGQKSRDQIRGLGEHARRRRVLGVRFRPRLERSRLPINSAPQLAHNRATILIDQLASSNSICIVVKTFRQGTNRERSLRLRRACPWSSTHPSTRTGLARVQLPVVVALN